MTFKESPSGEDSGSSHLAASGCSAPTSPIPTHGDTRAPNGDGSIGAPAAAAAAAAAVPPGQEPPPKRGPPPELDMRHLQYEQQQQQQPLERGSPGTALSSSSIATTPATSPNLPLIKTHSFTPSPTPSGADGGDGKPSKGLPLTAQASGKGVLDPPALQAMSVLCQASGVVVKQLAQPLHVVGNSLGLPYEARNSFVVLPLPEGRHAAKEHGEPDAWHPSVEELGRLPSTMYVEEESSCCVRACLAAVCCLNLRPLKLHFFTTGAKGTGRGARQLYVAERPCRLGAICGCPCKVILRSFESGAVLGEVTEDSRCSSVLSCCCLGTCLFNVLEPAAGPSVLLPTRSTLVHKYSLRTSVWCCGRVNNCCGATCCKPSLIQDVLEPAGGIASTVQKVYGAGGMEDCCRMAGMYDNYILEFPPAASEVQRALLITSVIQMDYLHFEQSSGRNGAC